MQLDEAFLRETNIAHRYLNSDLNMGASSNSLGFLPRDLAICFKLSIRLTVEPLS